MHATNVIGGTLAVVFMLIAMVTLTVSAVDHTDEGLLNEHQEQIGFIDIEPYDMQNTPGAKVRPEQGGLVRHGTTEAT